MNEIRLTNGDLLEVKVNFLTMKLIVDQKIEALAKRIEKRPNDNVLKMDLAAKMIYVILRSNGKKVDIEEACMLCPVDDEVIFNLFNEFKNKIEKFKKKQMHKM